MSNFPTMKNYSSQQVTHMSEGFRRAVVTGSVRKTMLLLWWGAKVNATDSCKQTALHLACESQHRNQQRIVKLLLKSGANVNARNIGGSTPLHLACWLGNKGIAEVLLRNGAKADLVDSECRTPLHVLAHCREFDESLVNTLLTHKACVSAVDSIGRSPLHYFCCRPGKTKSVSTLLKNGGNSNLKDFEGNTPLHLACKFNLKEVASLLLNRGANVELKNCNGMTALHLAALHCSDDVVTVLVDNGADVNAQDSCRNTALHLSCSLNESILDHINTFRRYAFVEKLLQKGAKVDLKNRLLKTPYDNCDNSVKFFTEELNVQNSYDLSKWFKILYLINNHVLSSKTTNRNENVETISTSSCSITISSTQESPSKHYDIAQIHCQNKTDNMKVLKSAYSAKDIPYSKVLSHMQPKYLFPREVSLYFGPCLFSLVYLNQTYSLLRYLLRFPIERFKIQTVQWFLSEDTKLGVMHLPYLIRELDIVIFWADYQRMENTQGE